MDAPVTSQEVAAYRGWVASIARRFVGLGGAEFDDLEQEGWIACWQVLAGGKFRPSETVVVHACLSWVRQCHRRGFTDEPLADDA